MSYYALYQMPVKQKPHSTQSSHGQEQCVDQWTLQFRFLFSNWMRGGKKLLTAEKIKLCERLSKQLKTQHFLSSKVDMTEIKQFLC